MRWRGPSRLRDPKEGSAVNTEIEPSVWLLAEVCTDEWRAIEPVGDGAMVVRFGGGG